MSRRFATRLRQTASIGILVLSVFWPPISPGAPTASSLSPTASPISGRLVEAYTGEPIEGADVYVFEGEQICMRFNRVTGNGTCEPVPAGCSRTLIGFGNHASYVALDRYLGIEEDCPDIKPSETLYRYIARLSTDQDGWFKTPRNYLAGPYRLVFVKSGYVELDVAYQVGSVAADSQWPLWPDEHCSVAGTARSEMGQPLAGVSIEVSRENFSELYAANRSTFDDADTVPPRWYLMRNAYGTAKTDEDGNYCINGLSNGTYDVAIEPPQGVVVSMWDSAYLQIVSDQETLEIDFPPLGSPQGTVTHDVTLAVNSLDTTVSGRVETRDTGQPVMAVVHLRTYSERLRGGVMGTKAVGYTDKNGRFEISGVGPGTWELEVISLPEIMQRMYPEDREHFRTTEYFPAERIVTVEREGETVTVPLIRLRSSASGSTTIDLRRSAAVGLGRLGDRSLETRSDSSQGQAHKATVAPTPADRDNSRIARPETSAGAGPQDIDVNGSCEWTRDNMGEIYEGEPKLGPKPSILYAPGEASPLEDACRKWSDLVNKDVAYEPRGDFATLLLDGEQASSFIAKVNQVQGKSGKRAATERLWNRLKDALTERAVEEVVDAELGFAVDLVPGGGWLRQAAKIGVRFGLQLVKAGVKDAVSQMFSSPEVGDWQIVFSDRSLGLFHQFRAAACMPPDSATDAVGCPQTDQGESCSWQSIPGYTYLSSNHEEAFEFPTGHVSVEVQLDIRMTELAESRQKIDLHMCTPSHSWRTWCATGKIRLSEEDVEDLFYPPSVTAKWLVGQGMRTLGAKEAASTFVPKDVAYGKYYPINQWTGRDWDGLCGPSVSTPQREQDVCDEAEDCNGIFR